MGGFHVKFRRTNECIYNAVEGELQLPNKLKADSKIDSTDGKTSKNICPEFFFGFYKDVYKGNNRYYNYGFDAGIIFHPYGDFRLVIYMSPDTKDGETVWFEEKLTTVQPGNRIYLEVYLMSSQIIALVKNPDNKRQLLGRLYAPLNDAAFNALNTGSFINREIVMASNLKDNKYSPSKAFFSKTTWRKTKITNAATHEVVHLTEQNSYLRTPYDDGEKYFNMKRPYDFKYYDYTVTEPGNDGLGDFVVDVAEAYC